MTSEKFFLKSKTVWGVVVVALPTLLPVFGVSLSGEDTALITHTGDALLEVFGLSLALYGRFKAGGLRLW